MFMSPNPAQPLDGDRTNLIIPELDQDKLFHKATEVSNKMVGMLKGLEDLMKKSSELSNEMQ